MHPAADCALRRPARVIRHRRLAALLLALVTLAACGKGASAATPTWVPQPAYTLEPNPGQPAASSAPAPSTGPDTGPSRSPSPSTPATDPVVVASGLSAPIGIAVLPDGTALVGERQTGRILRVQPVAGQPVTTVRTLTGLNTAGDGGLLDLAISPHYDEDGLIYAYITTATDNRVVEFTLTGPVTPVFVGIPNGTTDNAGRIAFDVNGNLLIGTGDSGNPALAQSTASLAGKVLNVTDTGQPVNAASPILTQGHHIVAGLCVDSTTGAIFESEPASAGSSDKVNLLAAGADYGWPSPTGNSKTPLALLGTDQSGAAGCAVTGGVFYIATLSGRELLAATISRTTLSVKLGAFTASLTGKYGRLITVAAAADGSLWLATSNKDGSGTPVAADERILHIVPAGGGAGSLA